MALNLISSYNSDTDSNCSDSQSTSQEAVEVLEAEEAQSSGNKSSFFFGGDDADSSDGEKDSLSKRQDAPQDRSSLGASRRLPSALSVLKGRHTGSSVFSSEKEQEDLAQQFTLSQHVPLTEKIEAKKKPVCRAFQRGECRRGNKCRFAHPSAPQVIGDAATVADAPKMYNADDIFAKKAKLV